MGYRGAFVSVLLLLPLLIFTNAKGALILLILVFCGWIVHRLFGAVAAIWALAGALALYMALGIASAQEPPLWLMAGLIILIDRSVSTITAFLKRLRRP